MYSALEGSGTITLMGVKYWLEISDNSVRTPIVGIPFGRGSWDVSSMSNEAGHLAGTPQPTSDGNTAITGNVRLADGVPGPFACLFEFRWGDEISILASGVRHVYGVRLIRYVRPSELSSNGPKNRDWLTLLTCMPHESKIDGFVTRFSIQGPLIRTEAVSHKRERTLATEAETVRKAYSGKLGN